MKFITKLLLVLIVALVVARAALPWGIEAYVNNQLQRMDAYTGSVDDVDVALIRGTYEIKGLRIDKRNGAVAESFITVESLRLGLDWSARLDALLPFQANSFDVKDGTMVFYRTVDSGETSVMVRLHSVSVVARDFTNIRETEEPVFATVRLNGDVQEAGELELFSEIDPLSDPPVMTLDAKLIDLPLTELNPLLEAYANLDAETGLVEIFVEYASREGRFDGYVKPLVRDAEILRLDEEGSFLGKLWEGIADAAKAILENPDTERVGARVPLEGKLDAVDAELIPAIFSILENAFIEALSVGIGNNIGLEDIGLDSPSETDSEPE